MTVASEWKQQRGELQRKGVALYHYDDGEVSSFPYDAPWLDDEAFAPLYDRIRHNTLVDRTRCWFLTRLAGQVTEVEGDVLEVGVWRGGTGALLAKTLPGKTIFLADTFEGVVKSSDWEHYTDRRHDDSSINIVKELLAGLDIENAELLPGIFPDDTGDRVKDRRFSMVHIDVDVYRSAKDILEWVWPRLSVGGLVVFDDYGFFSACAGISRLIEEVRNDPDKFFIHNLNGHGYIVRVG